MRRGRSEPRGESGRVAARVRDLLIEHDGPSGSRGRSPDSPDLPWGSADRSAEGPDVRAELGAGRGRGSGPSLGQRLAARLPVRLDPGRRAAVAVGLAVVLAAVVTGVWLMSARPSSVAVSASAPAVPGASPLVGTDGAPASASAVPSGSGPPIGAPSSSAAVVVVDVAGKVHHPGLYHLPPGSRVDDALTAAGGPLRGVNLSSLNLAAKVVDGQQIAVGLPGAAAGPAGPAGGEGAAGGGAGQTAGTSAPVDLNTATLEQLETLPGVGPVLGQHILDWRTAHGHFTSVDQLQDVSGIGPSKFAAMRDVVSV